MNVSIRVLLIALMVMTQTLRTETAQAQQDKAPPVVEAVIPDISGVWNCGGGDVPLDQLWVQRSKSGGFEISMNGGAYWVPVRWSVKTNQFEGKSEHNKKSTNEYELKLKDDGQSLRLEERSWLGPGTFVTSSVTDYLRVSKEVPKLTLSESPLLAQPATEHAATAKLTAPPMPDIEGVWEAKGTEYKRHSVAKVNRNEMIIRRSQDGKNFVLTSHPFAVPLTWSATSNHFWGGYTGNDKVELRLELSVAADTNALRVKRELIHLDGNVIKDTSEVEYVRIFKTVPPDIAGPWRIVRWDNSAHLFQSIQIESHDSAWKGTYRDWAKTARGEFEMTWSPESRQFKGTWSESGHRSGTLTIRLLPDGKTMRGSWTTDAGSRTSDKEPAHSDLEWVRADTDEVKVQASEPTGPKNEAVSEVVKSPDEAAEIKVFTLANGDAVDYVKLLRGIFPDAKFQADSRTNQIIAVFKKPESAPMVEALLLRLDETKTPMGVSFTKGGSDPARTRSPQELISAIDGHEHRAITLARQIREQAPKHPNSAKAREELNAALQAALEAKFLQEQQQLQQLEERLARLQKQLNLRQAAASKIVERRAQELLEGDLKWNADQPTTQKPIERSTSNETSPSPLLTHTQVEFLEPSEMQCFFEGDTSPRITPTYYDFKRDPNENREYKFRLLLKDESPIAATAVMFPLDFAPESFRLMGTIKLRLTTVDLKQIQLGQDVTIIAYVDQTAPQLTLGTLHSTEFDSGINPLNEAQRRGPIVAMFRFAKSEDREVTKGEAPTGLQNQSTTIGFTNPPPFPVIHVDVHSGSDRKQSAEAIDKLVFALHDLSGVSVMIRDIAEPKGDAIVAIVREWRGQASAVTKQEINAAFKSTGIQDVRWEQRPKPAGESSIPANKTQIHFTGPVGLRAAFPNSWDPVTFPGFTNFERRDGISRSYLHLFPHKATVEYPAAIDIYPTDVPRVSAFLATNPVPFEVTDEDLQLMMDEKNVTKIVYLRDNGDVEKGPPQLETLVTTRLDPKVDHFVEARRRGQIVAVLYFGPQAVLEPPEPRDPTAAWIWNELRIQAKPITDTTLVPEPFRGGLQITEVNSFTGNQIQKGDLLIGLGIWETLSLDNVVFALEQSRTKVDRTGNNSQTPNLIYLLRNGELVVARHTYRGRTSTKSLSVSPGSSMSLDQWIDILQRKQVSNDSTGHFEAIQRIGELASGRDPKEMHKALMALFIKGESLDVRSQSDGPVVHEILEQFRKMPADGLLPLQIEILQSGGPARTQLALYSLKKLREYTTSSEFPALVELLWKFGHSEDAGFRTSALSILADTLSLTRLKPAEFSTEERRQMVQRLIDDVPRQKVIELLSSALESQQIAVAMEAAVLLKDQPEEREDDILQKKLQVLINVVKGKLGENKPTLNERAAALSMIGSLGSKAAPAVPTLLELLERDDPDLKADQSEAVNLGPGRGRREFTVGRIVSVLGSIGPAASAALPELEARLKLVQQQEREDALLSPGPRNRRDGTLTTPELRRAIDRIKAVP